MADKKLKLLDLNMVMLYHWKGICNLENFESLEKSRDRYVENVMWEEKNCGKQKSNSVTAGNNIVDSNYRKCFVCGGGSTIFASVRSADRRNDRNCLVGK